MRKMLRVLRRDTCARSTTDTHGCNARKHVTDVFAVCNQTEETLCLTAQTRAFAFRQTAPDAVTLAVRKRVLETIETYIAVHAHSFRGVARTSPFGEKQIGIFTAAKRALLPVVTDAPHAGSSQEKNTQDCNYVRVIVVMRSTLSRGAS
jgi:hypothetical protein